MFIASMMMKVKLDWAGSLLGLLGAAMLASNSAISGLGWIVFIFSNAAWISYGVKTKMWSVVIMQAGCTATSVLGIYRWLI